jgi:hypothetical protein
MTKLGVVVLLSPGERRSGSGGRTSRELTDVPQALRAQTVINDWNDIYNHQGPPHSSHGWRTPAAFAAQVTEGAQHNRPNSRSGGWTDKRGPVTRLTALSAND